MVFVPMAWHDLPVTDTPIIAARLSRIENGIAAADAAAAAALAAIDGLEGGDGSLDPASQRQVNAAILQIVFDEVTSTWPARSSVTSSPAQAVEWKGNAQPPTGAEGAVPGVDTWFGPRAGSSVVPGATIVPTPDPDPVTGISLSVPIVTVVGSSISVSVDLTTTTSTSFTYAQIAVRGPGGQKIDTAYHPGAVVNGTLNLSGTVTGTASGTWRAFGTYNLLGGASDWVDGPSTSASVTVPTTPTPPPGPGPAGAIPLIGNSGLAWNSGTFQSGNDVAASLSFGTWRGRPLDAMLTFGDRSSWTGMFQIHSSWAPFNGLLINSIPPQPQGSNDAATAAGDNNTRWRNYGTALAAAGLNRNRYMIRIWEVNGDWYDWAMGGGKNSAATFVRAIQNISTAVKSTAPNVKISVNFNRGNSFGADWRTAVMDPLIQSGPSGRYVDNIGLDSYDWYPGQTNSTNWNNAKGQNPGLDTIADYCRDNGIQMSLEEWALVSASGGASGAAGGDNAYYITQMWDWFVDNADILSYEGYYNNAGAPSTLQHVISTGTYPTAAAAYRHSTRWGV